MSLGVQDKFPTLQYLIKSYITWGVTNELLAGAHLSSAAVYLCAPDDAEKANKAHYFLRVCSRDEFVLRYFTVALPSDLASGDKFLPVSVSRYLVTERTLNSLKVEKIIITWLGERTTFSVLLTTFTRNFLNIYHSCLCELAGWPTNIHPGV